MTILDIQYRTYRLPFVTPFSTAHGTLIVREGAILTLTSTQGIPSIGEIAPFPSLSRETLAEALLALNRLIPRLRGMTLEVALELLERERVMLPASTMCGVEMALLDAIGHVGARSIAPVSHTSASLIVSGDMGVINRAPTVAVNGVIGVRNTQNAVKAAISVKQEGFSCVKLKVGMCENIHEEIARISAVREALGPRIALRLDANEAWSFEQARDVLTQCVPYDIQYVEQPLPTNDIEGMRRLKKTISIPIAADEAVRDFQSARVVMEQEAADVLILKPQLMGGLLTCQQVVDEATRRGLACVLTTTIESGVSVAATLQLVASLPEITLPCGLATLPLLTDDLINEDILIKNGFMVVPAGPGFGVTVDETAMER